MKILSSIILSFLIMIGSAVAADYNYISQEDMKQRLEAGSELLIVDIQVQEEYAEHHLPGSLPTFAYPVKSAADRAKIDQAVQHYQKTEADIVIVCPRGKGGAKRCYDYLKSQNVPTEKLFILEKGMSGWPYKELVATGEK